MAIARTALAQLGLARILWIPGGTPPHREAPRATPGQRRAMLELAIAGEPRYAIDDRELCKATPGYTVETLGELRASLGPQVPLVLLIGADQYVKLTSWHRWRDLFTLAHVAVFTRPGWAMEQVQDAALREAFDARRDAPAGAWRSHPAGAIVPVEMPPLAVSSTAIRGHIAARQAPRGLLPDAVLDYIAREGLYPKGN